MREAAEIDGCSRFRALWRIVMPLTLPAMITSTLVNLVWAWNELLIALVFLQDNSLRTLMVGVTLFKSRYTLNIPVIMAGLAIVSIPLIIIYVFAQKKLVEGLLSGSIKE
jgi:ABC-type glycerol-3-phosphate transport system permease component